MLSSHSNFRQFDEEEVKTCQIQNSIKIHASPAPASVPIFVPLGGGRMFSNPQHLINARHKFWWTFALYVFGVCAFFLFMVLLKWSLPMINSHWLPQQRSTTSNYLIKQDEAPIQTRNTDSDRVDVDEDLDPNSLIAAVGVPLEQLKIFVYNLPPRFNADILRANSWCAEDAFSTEVHFHQSLLESKYRTLEPLEAHFFYVPIYPACLVVKNFDNFDRYRGLVADALMYISDKYPFFNRSQGADHIWTFSHDFGACLSWTESVESIFFRQLRHSIFFSHLGDLRTGCFNPHKDIVIPPLASDHAINRFGRGGAGLLTPKAKPMPVSQSKSMDPSRAKPIQLNAEKSKAASSSSITNVLKSSITGDDGAATMQSSDESALTPVEPHPVAKTTFAYFRGTIQWYHQNDIPALKIKKGYNRGYSNGVRQKLARLYGQDPLFSMHQGSHGNYVQEVQNSVFCLCPRGFASWSRRLFDSIQLGCIPVIIADDTYHPFEELIDFRSFSVRVAEKDIKNLKQILLAIPPATIRAKQLQLRKVWKLFSYQKPAQTGDAMWAALIQLARKARSIEPTAADTWS